MRIIVALFSLIVFTACDYENSDSFFQELTLEEYTIVNAALESSDPNESFSGAPNIIRHSSEPYGDSLELIVETDRRVFMVRMLSDNLFQDSFNYGLFCSGDAIDMWNVDSPAISIISFNEETDTGLRATFNLEFESREPVTGYLDVIPNE